MERTVKFLPDDKVRFRKAVYPAVTQQLISLGLSVDTIFTVINMSPDSLVTFVLVAPGNMAWSISSKISVNSEWLERIVQGTDFSDLMNPKKGWIVEPRE